MTWLAPLWLAGFAALAVPILIHLRRRRLGPRVRVGSIRHLAGSATPRARRLRLRDLWLLALRLIILALLVCALAEPVLDRTRPAEAWVLVSPELLADSAVLTRDPLLDSLRQHSSSIRILEEQFPTVSLRSHLVTSGSSRSLWSLLREADTRLPPGSTIMVVLPRRGLPPSGPRPSLASRVSIRLAGPSPPDSSTWLEAVWASHDSVTLVLGIGASGGIATRSVTLRLPAAGTSSAEAAPLSITPRGDSGFVAVLGTDSLSIARLAEAHVAIIGDSLHEDDARYLSAAFGATADAFHIPLTLTRAATGAAADWTIWLGRSSHDSTAPAGVRLEDAGGTTPLTASMAADGAVPLDLFGRPLLSERNPGRGILYQFGGRFNPAYGDFVLRPEFPALIARLWAGPRISLSGPRRHDVRAVDPVQLTPRAVSARGHAPEPSQLLRRLLFMAAAVLFLVERAMAYRRSR